MKHLSLLLLSLFTMPSFGQADSSATYYADLMIHQRRYKLEFFVSRGQQTQVLKESVVQSPNSDRAHRDGEWECRIKAEVEAGKISAVLYSADGQELQRVAQPLILEYSGETLQDEKCQNTFFDTRSHRMYLKPNIEFNFTLADQTVSLWTSVRTRIGIDVEVVDAAQRKVQTPAINEWKILGLQYYAGLMTPQGREREMQNSQAALVESSEYNRPQPPFDPNLY